MLKLHRAQREIIKISISFYISTTCMELLTVPYTGKRLTIHTLFENELFKQFDRIKNVVKYAGLILHVDLFFQT